MSAAQRLVALAAVAVLALAGCTETPSVVRSSSSPAPMAVPDDARAAPNPDLSAAKQAAGIADCPSTTAGPVPGGLPDVVLQCLGGGREVRLSGLRGPMLVNVWAQWCGGCREEAPYLQQFAARGTAVRVVGVDHAETRPELAVAFAKEAGQTYPQLYDADLTFRTKLQVMALPVTFFVRADGTIAGRHPGYFRSLAEIDDLSRQLLGVTS